MVFHPAPIRRDISASTKRTAVHSSTAFAPLHPLDVVVSFRVGPSTTPSSSCNSTSPTVALRRCTDALRL